MSGAIVVLKFGSSVLADRSDMPAAVHEIYGWYRGGHRVIAVVSAIGRTTNALIDEAADLSDAPEPHALAELLATGERHAAALLGIALDRAGVPVRVVDPRDIHLTAHGRPLDGEPVMVGHSRLEELLAATPVLVVPGFFGHDAQGRLQLLGRGGSDLTAVFLAAAANADRCRLIKDVDGVYECDPAEARHRPPRRYASLDYATSLRVAASLVQPKAVRHLERRAGSVEIAALAQRHQTVIGPYEVALEARRPQPRSSVLLLGLGTVGFGVYRRLCAMPREFEVVGALCLDPAKHVANGVPPGLLHDTDSLSAIGLPDFVVDALPGLDPSRAIVRRFLERGASVVTANKRLIAEDAPGLERFARQGGGSVRYSAAVGGSAPMIEAVCRVAARSEIPSIEGILNGTCNFLLDRCADGLSLDAAIAEAQARGFAEADPGDDLIGADAARKLRILARHAFGRELAGIDMRPLTAPNLAQAASGLKAGQVLRAVARASLEGGRLLGTVSLRALDAEHPLAAVHDEWNRLVIHPLAGPAVTVSGRGAGRWPTTEAVIADLLDIRHGSARAPVSQRQVEPEFMR